MFEIIMSIKYVNETFFTEEIGSKYMVLTSQDREDFYPHCMKLGLGLGAGLGDGAY